MNNKTRTLEAVVADPFSPATSDRGGRELLGLAALVIVLAIAFVGLLVEPTQASVPQVVDRIASALSAR